MTKSRKPIAAILFDKDGTLIDFHRSWGPILRKSCFLAARGDDALADQLMRLGGLEPLTLRAQADSLFASGNTIEIADAFIAAGAAFQRHELIAELDLLFVSAAESAVPATSLQTLFAGLRASGYRLGIASSDSEAAIFALLANERLTSLVDFVCGYDSGHGHKPEPGMVLGFSEAIGCPPSEIVMVGDNLHDIRMGRAAGCGLVVGVLTGTGTMQTLGAEADLVLASIAHLPDALRR